MKTKASKIVALWAAPRCVSNAFEKTFSQRHDTAIVHEPFGNVYYFSKWRRSNRCGNYEEMHNFDINSAIKVIASQLAPLTFFKDMAFYSIPYIDKDFKDFLASITNTFIVRHPQEVMASWYRLNEYPTEEEFGFRGLLQMWKIVTEELNQKPIVVEGNSFRRNPEKVLHHYCQQIGVDFYPQMLSWEDARLTQGQFRNPESYAKWRKTLNNSSGILPPTEVKQEIRSEDVDIVDRALKVYENLCQFAV